MTRSDWHHCPAPPPCEAARGAAAARQAGLTKPAGALGRLEELAITLAGHQGTDRPSCDRLHVVLFAGDHGVVEEGVSAYPGDVTVGMLANIVAGGAAIAVLARALGATIAVVDAGSRAAAPMPGVVWDKTRCGTRNLAREAAMLPDELRHALAAGARAVDAVALADRPPAVLVLGEMGIGNTTSAAAVAAAVLGEAPDLLVGAGTGIDPAGVARKAALIGGALARHGFAGRPAEPLDALQALGGYEIAALAGAVVRAAQARTTVLVDGFIASTAALCAARMNPSSRPWMIFAHRSAERGHARVLEALGAAPLLDLGLRLGEGSGAAAAVPLLRLACALHGGMATFAEAGVSRRG